MQERRIDPAEGLEVRRLFTHTFPLFIVPIMALLAVFRSNEDLFNFLHPVGLSLSLCLLRNGAAMIQAGDTHDEYEEKASGNLLCVPSAS
jgi:hypothetical protein